VPFLPYLFFGGTCRAALTRYQEILGGELDVMSMSDMPPGEAEVPPEHTDLVMHGALRVGDGVLMASDDPSPDFSPPRAMCVHYGVADVDEAERIFAALADGGEITMPMAETFWAPRFGSCVDRFGIPWMISAEPPAGD